jgi:energy-converting hydrogenase Eha subunit F
MGTAKMNRYDQELLDKQMRRLTPPTNEGVIAVMLAVMFLVGMTLGSVMSPKQSAPTQIASMKIASME